MSWRCTGPCTWTDEIGGKVEHIDHRACQDDDSMTGQCQLTQMRGQVRRHPPCHHHQADSLPSVSHRHRLFQKSFFRQRTFLLTTLFPTLASHCGTLRHRDLRQEPWSPSLKVVNRQLLNNRSLRPRHHHWPSQPRLGQSLLHLFSQSCQSLRRVHPSDGVSQSQGQLLLWCPSFHLTPR